VRVRVLFSLYIDKGREAENEELKERFTVIITSSLSIYFRMGESVCVCGCVRVCVRMCVAVGRNVRCLVGITPCHLMWQVLTDFGCLATPY